MSKTARTIQIADGATDEDDHFSLSENSDLSDETVYIEEIRVFCPGDGDANPPAFEGGVLPKDVDPSVLRGKRDSIVVEVRISQVRRLRTKNFTIR